MPQQSGLRPFHGDDQCIALHVAKLHENCHLSNLGAESSKLLRALELMRTQLHDNERFASCEA